MGTVCGTTWITVGNMKIRDMALLTMALLFPVAANAQSQTNGVISQIVLSAAGNSAFRIYLKDGGVNKLSACQNSFAYINASDSNYQGKVGTLLAAAAQSKQVAITYSKDAFNWCQIWDVEITY